MSAPSAEESRWLWVLLIVVAIVVLVPLLMMFMMPMIRMMRIMWWTGGAPGAGSGMSPAWGIGMMLVFLGVAFSIGYALCRAISQSARGGDDPAFKELRLAYARGDLSQEEFEQRREDLRRSK